MLRIAMQAGCLGVPSLENPPLIPEAPNFVVNYADERLPYGLHRCMPYGTDMRPRAAGAGRSPGDVPPGVLRLPEMQEALATFESKL